MSGPIDAAKIVRDLEELGQPSFAAMVRHGLSEIARRVRELELAEDEHGRPIAGVVDVEDVIALVDPGR